MLKTFGIICLKIIYIELLPLNLAALINVSSFISKTSLLASLAYLVQPMAPMASIALSIPPPRTPAMAMANTKLGNAKNTSTILIITLSNNPPIYPLTIPIKLPKINISETKISDEKIVLDAPYTTLENTHLPKASVPRKNSLLGAFSEFCKSVL